MARLRNPKSKLSFGGLRLGPIAEPALQKFLVDKAMSLAQYQRFVIKKHLREEKYLK